MSLTVEHLYVVHKRNLPEHLFFLMKYCPLVQDIGMMVREFANGLGDLGSIPGRVIPKTQTSLLNTQH